MTIKKELNLQIGRRWLPRLSASTLAAATLVTAGIAQQPHQIRVDADSASYKGTFAAIHGINAAPFYEGETVGQPPNLGTTWTGWESNSAHPGYPGIYNQTWAADYRAHFSGAAIPQSRSAVSVLNLNTIWDFGVNPSLTRERDFQTYIDVNNVVQPVTYVELKDQANYELTGFRDYLKEFTTLPTEAIWVLGNSKSEYVSGPLSGDHPTGFNKIPNHRANYALFVTTMLRHFANTNPLWNWANWTDKPVQLVEVWNEPYLNAAYADYWNGSQFSGQCAGFNSEEPFWDSSGQDYADLYWRILNTADSTLDTDSDGKANNVKFMAALNFPRIGEGPNASSWSCGNTIPFTVPFMDSMQNRYSNDLAAGTPWKSRIEAVAVHWYVDSPEQFVDRARNATAAFAHSDWTMAWQYDESNNLVAQFPELWVTEWNRSRELGGAVNYASNAGAMPFLANGLYYLDGLAHGDFLHGPIPSALLGDDNLPDHGGKVWQESAPLQLQVAGAQVFGGANLFWTREGQGQYELDALGNRVGPSKNRHPGLLWELYGTLLFQEAKNRLPLLDGELVQKSLLGNKEYTSKNVTVMAGRDEVDPKIVVLVSSLDRDPLVLPDSNSSSDSFSIEVHVENFPYANGYTIYRGAAHSRLVAGGQWTDDIDYNMGEEAELTVLMHASDQYDAATQTLSFQVSDMRKNSYEVFIIRPTQ